MPDMAEISQELQEQAERERENQEVQRDQTGFYPYEPGEGRAPGLPPPEPPPAPAEDYGEPVTQPAAYPYEPGVADSGEASKGIKPPPSIPEPEVVGAIPSTGEVIVKDPNTGQLSTIQTTKKSAQKAADYVERAEIEKENRKAVEQETILLADKQRVLIRDFNELPEKYKVIGMREGLDAMNRAIEKDRVENEAAAQELKPYRQFSAKEQYPEGGAPFEMYQEGTGAKEAYDITSAIRENKVSNASLGRLFGADVVAEVRQQIKREDEAISRLKDYETSPGNYDLAKFLRTNPGQDATLKDAGFREDDIATARKTNENYFGSKDAPLALEEFKDKYFQDKGWETSPPILPASTSAMGLTLTSEKDKARMADYSRHLAEATKAYSDRFGGLELAKQVGISAAEFMVPGVYLARNWSNLSTTEKAINIALDAAFVLSVFGKPLSAITRSVVKQGIGSAGEKALSRELGSLAKAAKAGNADAVRFSASRLKEMGEQLAVRNEKAGGKLVSKEFISNLITSSKKVHEQAYVIAAVGKSKMPAALTKGLKSIGKKLKEMHQSERGFIRIDTPSIKRTPTWAERAAEATERAKAAREMAKPEAARGAGKTKVASISVEDIKNLGISRTEADKILAKVGDNREAFIKEAMSRNEELKQVFADIDKQLNRKSYYQRMKELGIAGSTEKDKQILETLKRWAKSSEPTERKAISVQDIADMLKRQKERLAEVDRLKSHSKAAEVVRQAQANDARILAAASRSLASYQAQIKGRAEADAFLQSLVRTEGLTLAIAANPQAVSKALVKASHEAKANALAKVRLDIKQALDEGNKTKAEALARADTMANVEAEGTARADTARTEAKASARSETKTTTKTKGETKTTAKAETKGVVEPGVKPDTRTETKPAIKPSTRTATSVNLATITKPPISRPPRPPAVKPPRPPTPKPPEEPEPRKPRPRIRVSMKGKRTSWTAEDLKTARTWKQGIGWWLVFQDGTTAFSKSKPEGAKVIDPFRQKPSQTIQTFRGEVSKKPVTADMGIMDVTIRRAPKTPSAKGNNLGFRPDIRRLTKSDVRLGRPPSIKPRYPSRKVGRIYRTRIGKGEVLSRHPVGR